MKKQRIISQKQRDKISDYKLLCSSCHKKYDMTPETKAKIIKNLIWNTNTQTKKQESKKF